MFKALLIFIVILALLTCASGQESAKSDRERANLLGAVKTVREKSKLDSGDTVTYDRLGRETERVMVSDFGELMGKQTQVFDAAGQVKEAVFADPKGVVQEKSAYIYEAGRLVEIAKFDGKGILREKTKRVFGETGKLAEEVYLDPAIARAKTVFSYDGDGNAVEMSFFLINGQKATAPVGPCLGGHRVTHTYDAKGRVLKKAVFDTEGREKRSWEYSYNENGNWSRVVTKSGSTVTTANCSYELDPVGNWIKMTSVREFGDGPLETMLRAAGKTITPEELRTMKDAMPKPSSITTREITYY